MRVWEAVEYILADHYVSDAEAAQVLDPSFATSYNDGFNHDQDRLLDRQALGRLSAALNDPNISLEPEAAQRIASDLARAGYRAQNPGPRFVKVQQPKGVPPAVNGSPLNGIDPEFARLRSIAKHPRPGDELVNIAINDLPVDFSHEALRGHEQDARAAYDWVNRKAGAAPDVTQWHGTGNAAIGIQGTGWLRVMANKVMPSPNFEATMASIQPSIERGARVINLAAGMGTIENAGFLRSLVRAHPRVLFVIAAGNDGMTYDENNVGALTGLDNLPNLMVVGSAKADGSPSDESNRGVPWVTIAAQGENVWVPFSKQQAVNGNAWTLASGTSFACPQVSNCAGKLMLLCPELDAAQIRLIIEQTVDVVPAWRNKNSAGGVLNAKRAMSVAAAMSLVREQGMSVDQAIAATGISQADAARCARLMQSILAAAAAPSAPSQRPSAQAAPAPAQPSWMPTPYVPLSKLR